MATVNIVDTTGKATGSVELPADVFGIQPNVPVMHQVVTAQLAHRRSGTQSTKTRAEVSGGGKKPFRQKGTGGARQGSIRAPHYSGGGIALGPKPRKYGQRTPRKMVRLALASALSDRAAQGRIVVVDSWGIDAPSTKSALAALRGLGVDGRVYGWGAGGVVGDGTSDGRLLPVEITAAGAFANLSPNPGAALGPRRIVALATSDHTSDSMHMLAIDDRG
jgi:large subunit ribosomal protein L4